MIAGVGTRNGEAVCAGKGAQVQPGTEAARPAEHDVGLARISPPAGITLRGPDDQVVDPVAVDVAGGRD